MPKITFLPDARSAVVPPGTTILEAARTAGVNLPANCGGVCACTTCHVWVEKGLETLSGIGEIEDERLQQALGLSSRSRLGCQARVGETDVVVRIPGNRIAS